MEKGPQDIRGFCRAGCDKSQNQGCAKKQPKMQLQGERRLENTARASGDRHSKEHHQRGGGGFRVCARAWDYVYKGGETLFQVARKKYGLEGFHIDKGETGCNKKTPPRGRNLKGGS